MESLIDKSFVTSLCNIGRETLLVCQQGISILFLNKTFVWNMSDLVQPLKIYYKAIM